MAIDSSYRNNPFIKGINTPVEYTAFELEEYVKCATDPIYFLSKYYWIVNLDKGLMLIDLYPFQKEIIKIFHDNKMSILKLPRQSSKTTITVGYILWASIFNPNYGTAILANKASIAREILDRYQLAYENLPWFLQQGVKKFNESTVELENGSKIMATATSISAIRGFSINLLFIDEAAWIPNNIMDEFFSSVYPTISSGQNTKFIMSSCVVKESYIFTPEGIKQIKDYINYDMPDNPSMSYSIPRYSVYGMDGVRSGEYFCNNGRTETRIIRSSSGIIECSREHKFWAYKDGKFDIYRAKELTTNDYISIKYGENIWGNNDDISDYIQSQQTKITNTYIPPETITRELAYFLGLFLAEGCVVNRKNNDNQYCVIMTCGDDITYSLNSLNLRTSVHKDEIHYNINSKSFVEFLQYFGFDTTKKAKEKIIPKRLFSCSKEIITAFLSGFFDGDGTATSRGKVSVISSSKELIFQIRVLLLNLGLLTQYYTGTTPPTKRVKVSSVYHKLEINDYRSCMKFYEEIGFRLERKQNRKHLLTPPKRRTSHDIIPDARLFLESQGLKFIEPNRFKSANHATRERCLEIEGIDKFPEIFHPNIKWEKIKSIEESENEVYDFSLDVIEGDKWCHSVTYQGIIGFNTPRGLNTYYKFWTDAKAGRNGFVPFELHYREIPGRDDAWEREQRAVLGPKFEQEYACAFLGSSNTLISGEKLATLTYANPIPNAHPHMTVYELPIDETADEETGKPLTFTHNYVICVDVSEGKNLDYSAFSVFDVSTMPYRQVAIYRNNAIPPMLYPTVIKMCAEFYNEAQVLIEINNNPQVADTLLDDLEYENVLRVYSGNKRQQTLSNRSGINTALGLKMSPLVKRIGCSTLKTLVENDKLILNDFETISELTTFVQTGPSWKAEEGCHDDLAMTSVIFSWMVTQKLFKDMVNHDIRKQIQLENLDYLEEEMPPVIEPTNGLEIEHFMEDNAIWLETSSPDCYKPIFDHYFRG